MDRLKMALVKAAAEGSKRMHQVFYEPTLDMKWKPDKTPVSRKKDRGNGELMVRVLLHNGFGGYTILCEDFPTRPGHPDLIVRVDPWDGSSFDFAHVCLPCVGVTVTDHGEDVMAAVAMPFGEGPDDKVIILAEKGSGAWQYSLPYYWKNLTLDEPKQLHVQNRPYDESVAGHIVREVGPTTTPRQHFVRGARSYVKYWESARSSIGLGMLVAQGRYVLALEDCVGGHHDIGPSAVIVPEAGGSVFTPDGTLPQAGQYHACLVSNGQHDEFLRPLFAQSHGDYQGFRELSLSS